MRNGWATEGLKRSMINTEKPHPAKLSAVFLMAEMWGFEPQRRRNRPTGFRIRTLQPLGYISI